MEAVGSRRVIAFYGQMGAGKTTFIKALCQELGVEEVIVNEYGTANDVIYHFDFYRIKRIEEVYDMGYEDYFFSGRLCLIEWPELIEELLPDDALRVHIEVQADGSRLISISE